MNAPNAPSWLTLRWPVALVLTAAIVVGGAWMLVRSPPPLASVEVTTAFTSYLPTVSRTPGGLLDVATLTTTEVFSRTDRRTAAWGWVDLGTTISEIRAPVTTRYHVPLAGDWEVVISGNICRVTAPALRPSLPAAIHTDKLTKRVEASWLRFDAEDRLDALQRDLTPMASRMAGDPAHLALVREDARRTVEEFVRTWLLTEQDWVDDAFHVVIVRFADEDAPSVSDP